MNGEIRRAQLVQTFGVGAIVDSSGETFVVKDTRYWKTDEKISCERLSRLIGNVGLRTFSGSEKESQHVPVARFPRWYYCPSCKLMRYVTKQEDRNNETESCPQCQNSKCRTKPDMIPMRFVAYCSNGHLAEINWHAWAHLRSSKSSAGQCKDKHSLSFVSGGRAGGDFQEMTVRCSACGAVENLSAIQRQFANPGVVEGYGNKCCGKQPWQDFDDRDACNEQMKIEPRGSSSIHRAIVLSALDIEQNESLLDESFLDPTELSIIERKCNKLIEDSEGITQILLEQVIDRDTSLSDRFFDWAEMLEVKNEKAVANYAFAFLKEQLQPNTESTQHVNDPQLRLLDEEYDLLASGEDVNQRNFQIFFNSLTECEDKLLEGVFCRIGQVKRLREVRAFTGFVRGEGKTTIPPDLSTSQKWVPALEAFGEGIYFELNSDTITSWLGVHGEQIRKSIQKQLNALEKLQERVHIGITEDLVFLLAHTMAHVLIRDLTFR